MSNVLSDRPIVFLNLNEQVVEVLRPEFVVVQSKVKESSSHSYRWDVGSFCYPLRDTRSQYGGGVRVDESSFDQRRRDFVRKFIGHMAGKNPNTLEGEVRGVRRFLNWVDSGTYGQLHDCGSMEKAYQVYTVELLREMQVSGIAGSPLSQETARGYQRGARLALSIAFDLDEPYLRRLATFIGRNKKSRDSFVLDATVDDKAITFAALVNVVDEVHRVLVLKGDLPLRLVSENDELFNFYSARQVILSEADHRTTYNLLKGFDRFPSRAEVRGILGVVDESIDPAERNAYYNARASYKKFIPHAECSAAREMANKAMVSGLISFISATGHNLSVCQELLLTTEKIVPSTQGRRFSGAKGRANGKEVFPEFGVEFASVYKKILAIRKFVIGDGESNLVFPVFGAKGGLVSIQAINISSLKKFIAATLPNVSWVTPKKWRQNVSSEYLELSNGDTPLTAEKLGNTESVVRSHYGRPSFQVSADQLNRFFSSLHESALARVRNHGHIPVKVLQDDQSSVPVPAGQCDSEGNFNPALVSGFTPLAPSPSCKDPETCLFCVHYGVHADAQDVRRVLSLKEIIRQIKPRQSAEQFSRRYAPLLHRIDEVIETIRVSVPLGEKLVSQISNEIECGDLDVFWGIHFDTLVSVGVVT